MLVIIDESAKEVVKIDREEKLKELMDGYSKLVFSICYRLTNDYFTAEDLTQETFLSVYSSLDRFDGRNERVAEPNSDEQVPRSSKERGVANVARGG